MAVSTVAIFSALTLYLGFRERLERSHKVLLLLLDKLLMLAGLAVCFAIACLIVVALMFNAGSILRRLFPARTGGAEAREDREECQR